MVALWKKFNLSFLPSFNQDGGFVALDIGSSSVKLVETAIEKSSYRLLNLGIAPLPPKAIQNNMVADSSSVVNAVRTLIQEHRIKATNVISAVPGRAVIMKKVQLPRQEDEELEANVEFEANNVIPENLQNVNLDYQVLGYLDGGNKMEVLLVAVKKEIVNSYADVIVEAGLKPVVMDVDYFAMENMYEASYPDASGIVGLIHIGARYTSITLLQNGVSTFTGDLPVGGEEFTEALRSAFNLTVEEAEVLKLTGRLNGEKTDDADITLRPLVEDLTDEIRRTVTLYGSVASEDGEGLKSICLSGGSANLPGLATILQDKMAVPVSLVEPFRGFTVNKKIDRFYLTEAGPLFAVAAGLSIRRPGDK